MYTTIINGIGLLMGAALLVAALTWLRPRGAAALGLLGAVLLTTLVTAPAQALQVRSDEEVTIEQGETVDETLIVSGTQVTIDGTVDADLLVAAQRLVVHGRVAGNIYAVAQDVVIEGTVDGSLHAGANDCRLAGTVERSAYLMAQTATIDPSGHVKGDALVMGQWISSRGQVDRDLAVMGAKADVTGAVERNLSFMGEELKVGADTRIGGDLKAKVPSEEAVAVHTGASIGGERHVDIEQAEEEKSEYLQGGFYLGLLTDVLGALLIALLLFLIAPRLLPQIPSSAGEIGKRLGIGFLLIICVPVAVVLLLVTVIGIPLALALLGLYLLAGYLAGVVVAVELGRRLLNPPERNIGRFLLASGTGLVIVTLLTHIPFVGPGMWFLVLILGVGSLLLQVRTLWRGQTPTAA